VIPSEGRCTVIPPTERLLGLIKISEDIYETGIEQFSISRTLRFADVYVADPRSRIMHVTIFRCDIEVAKDDDITILE
jgi:hypothetical protein